MVQELSNMNPVVYERKECRVRSWVVPADFDEYTVDPIDQQEVFDHIRDIKDPEHPNYTLEQLQVITEDSVEIDDKHSHVRVTFIPTVGNCKMASSIGLFLHVKLKRSLPSRYKVDIRVAPGTHELEAAVNKRINDKERLAAGLENPVVGRTVERCLAPTYE
ncbi:protein AE7-like [Papaver somniferum]|uniref:protein AE7-like n=1 Tax=Papaver somniferum TaxID=3469 RepID=UPI000E6FEA8A|nr:protein AE7-like [Papaver somniferum]XP_026417827.1 protein AE7-like [Papaver somniferum]XP_026417835.1 protein AE7-like [Papaver somniferum]XP_026417841.1 protein AE7-like [Papaver somniferum]XP_026417849.1 protein AE7-like [Papaver somniferum]XP_026417856.1 protein AE7-like [Papaver somniferum]XP_026417863.1 protein AE7-like [Papaver somniferum]XP_026417870.1 protein AE7-like [Papaver somniferum]XP_026417878.1 protein AE7-like [Papaver somniferum]XP_026417885.1 protein AE7-like [Papav